MKTIEFKALPDETTPLNPTNLNKMQSNTKDVFTGQNAMGSIVVEDIECKNLFDGALELGTINNTTGQNEVDNMVIRSKHFIEVKINTVYTLSNYINASNFVFEYDANYNFIKYSSSTEQSYTFTTTQTTKYIRFRTRQSENITNLTTLFQLEKGNTATQFVEHKEFDNRPKILWSNSNPNAGFNAQTINLSSSNYDYLLINYKKNITDLISNTVIIKKGQTAKLDMYVITSDNKKYLYERYLTYNNDATYAFTDAIFDSNTDVRNWLIIPIEILGFKISR